MMQVEQLKAEITLLTDEDFARLRRWFADKDWERWDQQIEDDAASGKLDFLIDEAKTAKKQNLLREV
ncbi:MAG: hypothetical protein HF973_05585 [Chloroflexi bacterium]|nr:hypothetical protein [Chloroflexota bacterium]